MRPVTDVPPTLSVGASANAVLKDALISILVSLTVGNRWRRLPASHAALAGAETDAACANRSAGTVSASAVAAELRKNLRRSLTSMAISPYRRYCPEAFIGHLSWKRS
jgi:hypothetical protein